MNLKDIANSRCVNQQITGSVFKTAKALVGWMGAVQAQDYAMSKWALGLRLPGSTALTIQASIDKGEIIRTHVMRPTWHLVSSDDIFWMLELTAPKLLSSLKTRHRQLEISPSVLKKSKHVLENILSRAHLTRDEIVAHLNKNKIQTDNYRLGHLLLHAELDCLICSGKSRGNKQTYALLEERVTRKTPISRQEALTKLARIYFSSHGPATLKDYIWWSGLPARDARNGLDTIKNDLCSETIDSETYWFFPSTSLLKKPALKSLFLLPAYDEFLISYANRKPSLAETHNAKTISNNGIFRPVIILNGQVIGIWRRTSTQTASNIDIELFHPFPKKVLNQIEFSVAKQGEFLGGKITCTLETS